MILILILNRFKNDFTHHCKIVTNSNHILHALLPPPSAASQHYTLRRRLHSLQLPGHPTHLSDCNSSFIHSFIHPFI